MMAAAFLLGWARSTVVADFIGTPSDSSAYYFVSHGGLLEFQRSTSAKDSRPPENAQQRPTTESVTIATAVPWFAKPPPFIWGSLRLGWYDDKYGVRIGGVDVVWKDYDVEWQRSVGRFQVVAGKSGHHRGTKVVLPYWSLTIPLTLLSAYLILSKPRKRD
jgi:hypothetical protein